jgi:hypothetical protein
MATITIKTGAPKRRETLQGLLRAALHREKENLQLALARTRDELARFEKRYRSTSAKFYRSFQSGKLDDRNDFIDWAGEYRIYLLLKEQIASLRGLKIDRH